MYENSKIKQWSRNANPGYLLQSDNWLNLCIQI